MAHFLLELRPPRPTFPEDATEAEGAAVGAHFRYLQSLVEQGRCLMAGRHDDAEMGIAIFVADNLDDAAAMAGADPAVQAGVFSHRIKLFHIALWATSAPTVD